MKVPIWWVALLLVGIVVVSLGLSALTFVQPDSDEDTLSVTAAIFPMYTAALQVVGEVSGVSVTCLTAPTAGCLHDYQLSPDEMAALAATDVLVLNGVGAESFLDQALKAVKVPVIIDTGREIHPLDSCEEEHEHDHDHGGVNEHIWIHPAYYAVQVAALRDGLCAADPANAAAYTRNAAAYLETIAAVEQQWEAVTLEVDGAVLFHDSVAYVAQVLQVPVLATLPMGEEQGISAGELSRVMQAVQGKRVLLLFDEQYAADPLSLDTYAAQAVTVTIDTAIRPQPGRMAAQAWLTAMTANIQAVKEAAA